MYCTPMLVVRDVEASSRWYQELLGVESGHGGPEFEMLMHQGRMLLLLHHLEIDEHPVLMDPRTGDPARGVLLYVGVDDVGPVYERAVAMEAEIVDAPHYNPKARAQEFSLRDPDGYPLTISQWMG